MQCKRRDGGQVGVAPPQRQRQQVPHADLSCAARDHEWTPPTKKPNVPKPLSTRLVWQHVQQSVGVGVPQRHTVSEGDGEERAVL